MPTTARAAEPQAYCCRADADAAAARRRAVSAADQRLEVAGEARLVYGRGQPRAHKPRPSTARRDRLQTAISPQTERLARLEEEAGCVGRRPHRARALLTVDKEHPGTQPHDGVLKAPVLGKSLGLQQPERIEAWGLMLLLALLRWRVMERTMRTDGDTTRTPLPGGDKQATARPTAFRMLTKCAGVIVVKCGHERPLARPLAVVPQQYLTALEVPATWGTLPTG